MPVTEVRMAAGSSHEYNSGPRAAGLCSQTRGDLGLSFLLCQMRRETWD